METEHGSPPDRPTPEIESGLQAAVEDFLAALQRGERPDRAQVVAEHPELAPWLDERLKLVELVFQAAQDGDAADERHLPVDRAKRLKCPHCGNQVQLVEPRPKEVTCLNCGSSFRVEPDTTATYRAAGPAGHFGRFQVLELLGRGAFGEVYKARDSELDRFVALKVPRTDYFANSEEAQRFLREARSAAGLRHSSIVQVHEIAHERGTPYIVSDYIEGLTLADLISGGRPGFRESAELVAQLADALDYAHRQKVVHRDIKPSNILLAAPHGPDAGGPRFVPYLTDFGLARRDEGEIAVTLDGQVLGTPAYMSPEQAAGDHARVDGRSDVYSLGVMLYELLSGELPFRGSRRMLLHQVLHDEPRPPRTLNERIPRDLETICLKAMAKESGRRYHTAAGFRDDLRRFLCGDPITARRVGRPERTWRWCRRNPVIAGLALALALAVVFGSAASSYFAMAEHQARIDAETSEGNAVAARERSERMATLSERMAARVLISPLDAKAKGNEPLSRPEREALWNLASAGDDALRLRYLEEGTRDPVLAIALSARSEPAVIASVGLSLGRHDRAAALLMDRLADRSLGDDSRARIALLALQFVDGSGPLAEAVVRNRATNMSWLEPRLLTLSSHAEPNVLAPLVAEGFDKKNENQVWPHLISVADRCEPSVAERSLRAALQQADGLDSKWGLVLCLAKTADRMDKHIAVHARRDAAKLMTELFAIDSSAGKFRNNTQSIIELAKRMEPNEGATALIECLRNASFPQDIAALVDGLSQIASNMDAPTEFQLRTASAPILIDQLRKSAKVGLPNLASLLRSVPVLVDGMERVDRLHVYKQAVNVVVDALKPAPGTGAGDVGNALAAITSNLDPSDAATICSPAAEYLSNSLRTEQAPVSIARCANAWAPIAKMGKVATAKQLRIEAMQKLITAVETMNWQAEGVPIWDADEIIAAVVRLAAQLEHGKAADAARKIAPIMLRQAKLGGDEMGSFAYYVSVGDHLGALAALMDTTDGLQLLTDEFLRSPDDSKAKALLALVARAAPADRSTVWAAVVDGLVSQSRSPPVTRAPVLFAAVLATIDAASVADEARLKIRQVASAFADQIDSLPPNESYASIEKLVEALAALIPVLKPEDRHQISARVARVVFEKHRQSGWYWQAHPWPPYITRLTKQMQSEEADKFISMALANLVTTQFAEIERDRPWNIRLEWATVDCLALCDKETASDVAWLLAQVICSGAHAAQWGGCLYEGSRFDDLLYEPNSSEHVGQPSRRGCRLTTQQLVELLKMPTCFGAPRRVILDHLERRYDRRFNTVWAFVRFAEEEKLGLDFTSPPVRPDPAKMKLPLP
jgi:tRNA A-37 threonylcarbamoyl transferase component Bud32